MSRKPPPRGGREGVKADLAAVKDGQAGFAADKKPWHPLNFRNQMKRFEAEEEVIRRQKLEEANKAEFDAEQTYLETLAYLPGKDAEKYRDMQGVSWMYIKPPGMKGLEEQAKEKQREQESKRAGTAGGSSDVAHKATSKQQNSAGPLQSQDRERADTGGETARGIGSAIGHHIKFQRRPQSPPIGGFAQGSYEFVTEDEPEVDERLLQALQAKSGNTGTTRPEKNSSGSQPKKYKRQREEKLFRGSDGVACSSRARPMQRDREERYGRHAQSRRRSPDVYDCASDEHQWPRHKQARRGEPNYGFGDDRETRRVRSPVEGQMAPREHHRTSSRTDHERRADHSRGVARAVSLSHERSDKNGNEFASDGEEGKDQRGRTEQAKGRDKHRSHKEKKRKKRSKEKLGGSTFEDAVRFIVAQGLSAEDVLNEVKTRKRI